MARLKKGELLRWLRTDGSSSVTSWSLSFFKEMLRNSDDALECDEDGRDALMEAASHGQTEFCRLLLNFGGESNDMYCIATGIFILNMRTFVCMLNVRNAVFMWVCIVYICYITYSNILPEADPLRVDIRGSDALMEAAQAGHYQAASLLLAAGANPTRVGSRGDCLALASMGGHEGICRLLLRYVRCV